MSIVKGKRWKGAAQTPRAPFPLLTPLSPLASSLPQGCSVCELVYFWVRCLSILSARSVSSRVALRPERAVLNQPEFQGWIVRGRAICVLTIDLCSGDDSHCAICRFSLVRS